MDDLYRQLSSAAVMDDISEQDLKRMWDSDYPTYIVGPRGEFLYVNSAFVQYTVTPREKWIHMDIYRVRNTYDQSITDRVLKARQMVTILQNTVSANGEKRYHMTTGKPLFDTEGNIRFVLVIMFPLGQEKDPDNKLSSADTEESDLPTPPIAQSASMIKAVQMAERAAQTDAPCLISGDTGTGKSELAQYIHLCSKRKNKKMQVVNCAAVPENLVESELFGYEPGAFTGASKNGKKGMIESADGGTLFLDEINSLSLMSQGKLLRVLETKKIRRVGSDREIPVDFRLICATNVSLEEMCRKGTFREDLYYRINLLGISVLPIRQRREDIIPLANYFLKQATKETNQRKVLSANSYQFLMEYDWPGNVRELRNFIERGVLLDPEDNIILELTDYLPELEKRTNVFSDPLMELDADNFSLEDYMNRMEKLLLTELADQFKNTYELADFLKINQSTVVRKLKKYGIVLNGKNNSAGR